ncbi:hypothetical protein ACU8KH_05217 [Lachancea thermotolerans]
MGYAGAILSRKSMLRLPPAAESRKLAPAPSKQQDPFEPIRISLRRRTSMATQPKP